MLYDVEDDTVGPFAGCQRAQWNQRGPPENTMITRLALKAAPTWAPRWPHGANTGYDQVGEDDEGDDDRDDEHNNGDDEDDMVGPRITIQHIVAYES